MAYILSVRSVGHYDLPQRIILRGIPSKGHSFYIHNSSISIMKYYNAEYLKEHAEAPQNKLWPMAEILGGEDCPLVDALMYDKRITSVYVTDKAPEGAESKTLENFVAWYGRGPFEVATLGPNPFPTSIK